MLQSEVWRDDHVLDEQLERVRSIALSVPSEPRYSYRFRLAKAIIGEARGRTEREIFVAFRDDPSMARIVRVFHNLIVDVKLEGLSGAIDQCARDTAQSFSAAINQCTPSTTQRNH